MSNPPYTMADLLGFDYIAGPANPGTVLGIGANNLPAWLAATTAAQQAWIAPTLLNSWVNHGAGADVGYSKDTLGMVHLHGLVKDGTSATAIILNLPAGYRPAATERFAFASGAAAGVGRLDVTAGGDISPQVGGSTTWTSLDGISFRAA